ncbi:MAG: hypothetical protein SW127_22090 [Actinomycetota bacterium]|nr:hypothetical protein [Actinomycetota bacterium]
MSTPHGTSDPATAADQQEPHPADLQEPYPADRQDAAEQNAPTEPITQAGTVPPNGPFPPYGANPPMYPNQPPPNQPSGVSDKVRNAVIAGGIGVAVVFGLIGFGAGYVVGDSSSNQGPGMNMQRGGGFGPGGQGGFGQMPDGQGGMGQMPGQPGQVPGQGQLPGQDGQTTTPGTESGTGA